MIFPLETMVRKPPYKKVCLPYILKQEFNKHLTNKKCQLGIELNISQIITPEWLVLSTITV